jgi:hypothetical protein
MCGVNYGYSPRYKSKISHMVDCVHMTDKWAAILDNNFPGEDQYEWMAPDEFRPFQPRRAITAVGLPHDGKPTLILQAPSPMPDSQGRGVLLHIQHDDSDGPVGLAKAIRKADPSYDPKKDPDLRANDCPDCPHSATYAATVRLPNLRHAGVRYRADLETTDPRHRLRCRLGRKHSGKLDQEPLQPGARRTESRAGSTEATKPCGITPTHC